MVLDEAIVSWLGSEVIREEILNVVVGVVRIIEQVWLVNPVVRSVSIASIGMTVLVNNVISHIVFLLELFIISGVSVSKLPGVWLLYLSLEESSRDSSDISAAAEAKVLNNII